MTLWKHNQVLVASRQVWWLCGQDLVALVNYGQVLVVTVVCVCSVVVSVNNRHKNHPKKCLWWSYASLVVIWSLWK